MLCVAVGMVTLSQLSSDPCGRWPGACQSHESKSFLGVSQPVSGPCKSLLAMPAHVEAVINSSISKLRVSLPKPVDSFVLGCHCLSASSTLNPIETLFAADMF